MSIEVVSNGNINTVAYHFSELYPSLESDNISLYYDSNLFKASLPSSSDTYLSNIHLILISNLSYKFDVICLSEAWLKQGEKFHYYFLNCILYYSGRIDRTGRGVMICVANHHDCEQISELTVNLSCIEYIPFICLE